MTTNQRRDGFTAQERAFLDMKYAALGQAESASEHLDGKLVAIIQSDGLVAVAAAVIAVLVGPSSGMGGRALDAFSFSVLGTLALFAVMLAIAVWAWTPKPSGVLTRSILVPDPQGGAMVSQAAWSSAVEVYLDPAPRDLLKRLVMNIDEARDLAVAATRKKAKALFAATVLFLIQVILIVVALGAALIGAL